MRRKAAAARYMGLSSGHQALASQKTAPGRCLSCCDILDGFHTCTESPTGAGHEQRSPSHQGLTSPSLALNNRGVVDLDYVFTATYNTLCQEHFVPNTQSERLEHGALLPWMGAIRC